MRIAITPTKPSNNIQPMLLDNKIIYGIDELEKFEGTLEIIFPTQSIIECDSPILLHAIEVITFLANLTNGGTISCLSLYFEPRLYGIRVENDVTFTLFDPQDSSLSDVGFLETITLADTKAILSDVKTQSSRIFSTFGGKLESYLRTLAGMSCDQ